MKFNQYDLAIIGGGFSGITVACHTLYMAKMQGISLKCLLFEPSEEIGAGVAYRNISPAFLINVKASAMSWHPDMPSTFIDWLTTNYPEFKPDSFVPRYLYREYLEYSFNVSKEVASEIAEIEVYKEKVIGLTVINKYGYQLLTDNNHKYHALQIVLALGNLPFVSNFGISDDELKTPWNKNAVELDSGFNEVAIVGTGLSAIDVVLGLEANNYKGNYTLISRHGMLPQPHVVNTTSNAKEVTTYTTAISESISIFKALQLFRSGVEIGIPWIELIDSLRPFTSKLWQSISLSEKHRFLRHFKHIWETHRHRVPIESLSKITQLKELGRLTIIKAKVLSTTKINNRVQITLRKRGEENLTTLNFDIGYNCISLTSDLRKCNSEILSNLLSKGIASYDKMYLGLKTTPSGNLIDKDGNVVDSIYTLGTLRRGELWESTAAKEIRLQALQIATSITSYQNKCY
jgi:uncharacterized NAD(P)/FAD-binding protein YdhS